MSSNQINTLTSGTINGLNSLALDELTTTSLTAGTMDGDLFFIDRIEANEVIVDTQLRLTSTGVFSVGAVTISDIELTYLDGVSSNIQTQIDNINTNTSGLATTVATHTTQISALEASDTSQNTTLATHTSQISAIQTVNTTQNTTLATHTSQISALQTSDTTQNTNITNLQTSDTAQNTTLATHTAQISALQTSDATQNTNITNLQASDTTQNTNISNLQASDATQNTNISNLQSSDTTQNTQISALQTSDTTQNTNILVLQGRTQNITANSTTTSMSKPLIINHTGQALQMNGSTVNIKACGTGGTGERWYLGNDVTNRLTIINYDQDGIHLRSGCKSDFNRTLGWQPLKIYSLGVSLYRGGTETGNTETFIGNYGANQSNETDNTFYISGNGVNNVNILASAGSVNVSGSSVGITATNNDIGLNVGGTRSIVANTNVLYLGSGTANPNGFFSNLNMLQPGGQNWETQSRAFTEALRASVVTSETTVASLNTARTAAQTAIARIETTNGNFSILGRSTTLMPSFIYPTKTHERSLGVLLHLNGYSSYFNASGQWSYNGGATQRVCFQYDITFNSLSTGIKAFVCNILQKTSGGTVIRESRPMGVRYNQSGGNPLNSSLYVSTGEFVFDIQNLNLVTLETENFFSTSGDGASVTTTGRLTFYLLPY